MVEAAVSRGGRELKPGINVYRFANRIPLLFEVHPPVINPGSENAPLTQTCPQPSWMCQQDSDAPSRVLLCCSA